MSSKQHGAEKGITHWFIIYFYQKIAYKCFARELGREKIMSQMTDPLVCVTLVFKSPPQKCVYLVMTY